MTELTRYRKRHLETILQQQRKILLEEAEAELKLLHEQSVADVAGEAPDSGDESVAMLVTDINNRMAQRHVEELVAVDRALAQLHEDRFGLCSDCGREIAYERLEASPAATRCAECQTLHERMFAHERTPRL
jgi:DnaK suppressor protein